MSSYSLLLIESYGKLKKLKKILGSNWQVAASGGHIRELAKTGADALGFTLDKQGVTCEFVPKDAKAKQTILNLRKLVKGAKKVVIATDDDREGELIAWHLLDVLNLDINTPRIAYSEITEAAVKAALSQPRQVDLKKVNAGLARACLDKLVGFSASPLLWAYTKSQGKSVGRVQSAVLHLLAVRERKIQEFKPEPYFSIFVDYEEGFRAYFSQSASIESKEDSSEEEGESVQGRVTTEAQRDQIVAIAQATPHQVAQYKVKTVKKNPPAPFTTSTLQQMAGKRLGYSSDQVMKLAQALYEQGHITYLRTDSVSLSEEAVISIRNLIQNQTPDLLPSQPPQYKNKASAQEAHEAIRPTDLGFDSSEISDAKGKALYDLIWFRTVASQCIPATLAKTSIVTQAQSTFWMAQGQSIVDKGYLQYWFDLGAESILPSLETGQSLVTSAVQAQKKRTTPPARFTDAALVKKMESLGIGRPSTFATIIKTLLNRSYAKIEKKKMVCTELGLWVDDFLQQVFADLIDVKFTAGMEQSLDEIAMGKVDWQTYLVGWHSDYFSGALAHARSIITGAGLSLPSASTSKEKTKLEHPCPSCGKDTFYSVPSSSSKLAIPYYHKCLDCSFVEFWSAEAQQWQSPQTASAQDSKATSFSCPVCGGSLLERSYTKNNEKKSLLFCQTCNAKTKSKKKEVVYFASKGKWWSPNFGELNQ